MKPLRITKLGPNEWLWRCTWCPASDTIATQPAALHLAEAHYLLRHWPTRTNSPLVSVVGGAA